MASDRSYVDYKYIISVDMPETSTSHDAVTPNLACLLLSNQDQHSATLAMVIIVKCVAVGRLRSLYKYLAFGYTFHSAGWSGCSLHGRLNSCPRSWIHLLQTVVER